MKLPLSRATRSAVSCIRLFCPVLTPKKIAKNAKINLAFIRTMCEPLNIGGDEASDQNRKKIKMNSTEITTAARRIAREHNNHIRGGFAGNGKLVFGPDGTGGAWYSDDTYGFGEDVICVSMRRSKMTGAEAQEILDTAE